MLKEYTIFSFTLAGLIFSGYQSAVKLFSNSCAIDSCPFFLGYPACYFGFGLFAVLFVLAILLIVKNNIYKAALNGLIIISFLGILFAGKFTLDEIPVLLEKGWSAYVLILPTCAWGLLLFLVISVVALYSKSGHNFRSVTNQSL